MSESGELKLSAEKLDYVGSGMPGYTQASEDGLELRPAVSDDGKVAEVSNLKTREPEAAPIQISDFKKSIGNALKNRVDSPRLKRDGNANGKFYRMENGKAVGRDLVTTVTADEDPLGTSPLQFSESEVPPSVGTRGQALVACGTHDVFLTMEDVPNTSAWSMEYNVDQSCMSLYNQFMDIFRVTANDGTFGDNTQNEFGGYPTQATLSGIYGSYSWGTSLGVCFTFRISTTACSKITQSDVFWNPAYSYSEDPNIWWGSSSVYCMRQVTVHELGHVWGYQTGDAEQYNYDDPSVMHSVYSNIYETGKGLHAVDAEIFRNHYSSKTTVKTVTDVSADAYYASNGLLKSTINGTTFARGSAMTFTNVTVENMSNSAVNNVQMKFYLATARDFSGSEYQVGGTWSWATFNAISSSVGNYAGNTIPSNVPPGTYYVLTDASINGAGDNYNENNTGVFTDRVTIVAPFIGLGNSSFTKNINQGQNASGNTLFVQNTAANSGTMNYSLGISYGGSSSGWLSLSPSSGSSTTEADPIALTYSTSGLSAGTHTATITVSSPEATNSPRTCAITVNVVAVPTISRTPSSITRNITAGQNASSDTFEVWNSGNSSALAYSISDDVSWLSISPSSGSSSGLHQFHTISYNTSGLSQGNYFATISISSPGASNPSSSIVVFMNVGAPASPTLSRTPPSFTRSITAGQNASTDSFEVWNSANSSPMSYTISDDVGWLNISPTSGSSSGARQNHTISYSTSGLSQGSYSATILISAPGATNPTASILVFMTVSAPAASPTISRTPAEVFPFAEQGQNASSETFEVWNSGNTNALSYSIADNVTWLSVSPGSGSSSGVHQFHQITYSTSGLAPGTYNGTITISAPGATNPTSTINVSLYVNASTTPALSVSPSSFSKPITQGQNATSNTFDVWNSANSTPMAYSIADDQPWMTVSPASGTASSSHQIITVTYNTAALSAGNYSGTITVSAPSAFNTTANILVFLTVGALTGPPNDNLANAINIVGLSGTTTGLNTNGTMEINELRHWPSTPGGASVWWSWTAPITGGAVVDTVGSSFDTIMGVYTGNAFPLNQIGQDDDGAGNRVSRLAFPATSGTIYKIAVDGFSGVTGNVTLNHVVTPNSSGVEDWNLFE